MRTIGHFIGGREVKGTSGKFADVFQPMTGEVQANLERLNESFKLPYIPELIQRKTAGTEKSRLEQADLGVHHREYELLRAELTEVRARGWALADEELAPGVRSVAVPVRDGTGTVRAAMNVTVHAAETTVEHLLHEHLPKLLTTAGDISADWTAWQSRPHLEIPRPNPGPVPA